jgi:hypothetical protein
LVHVTDEFILEVDDEIGQMRLGSCFVLGDREP